MEKRYLRTPLGFIEIGIDEIPEFDMAEQWKADKRMIDSAPKMYKFLNKLR